MTIPAGRFPAATHAASLEPLARDRFAHFAHTRPYELVEQRLYRSLRHLGAG